MQCCQPIPKRNGVCILAFPIGPAGLVGLRNLTSIVAAISGRIYLITGGPSPALNLKRNGMTVTWIRIRARVSFPGRFLSYAWLQTRMAFNLASEAQKVDTCIFFIGGDTLLLPLLIARFLRKKTVLIRAGSSVETLEAARDKAARILKILSRWAFQLSDRIVVYSAAGAQLTTGRDLSDRILIARHHYLNSDVFRNVVPVGCRRFGVGYLGRLDTEKGILEFMKAIPIVAKARPDIRFLIAGDGALREEVGRFLRRSSLDGVVELRGWVPHDDIPGLLNSLKVAVLPSYTEGLPNVLVESMACGTIVVATPVGSIPDFVKDGVTGFLAKGNRPEELAREILRALNHPDLEVIVANASALAKSEFSFARAVEGLRRAIRFE